MFCTFSASIYNLIIDDPKPPGPVELDQNIPGTVTLSWASSPDEKRDDRLHYMISMRDSFKRTWKTVADSLFNNKFTVVNILPGREYYFRVFAKNDMGLSRPSESPVFEIKKEKGLCFQLNTSESIFHGIDVFFSLQKMSHSTMCRRTEAYSNSLTDVMSEKNVLPLLEQIYS